MTAVQSAPAPPPAPPEELTTPEPARLPRSAIFADAVVIARRNLTRTRGPCHEARLREVLPVERAVTVCPAAVT
jgi:hypothetical protein